MKKNIFSILFLLIALTVSGQEIYENQYLVKVGDSIADFEVALTDGSIFKLSEQRGKVVMLQFTASWCSVCRKEMPYIEQDIWQKLKDDDFVLVGIDYKEKPEMVHDFAKQMKISYPLGIDSTGAVFHLFSQEGAGVTRNIIINKQGEIIFLSRLFKLPEFNEMKDVIFREIDAKP